MSVAGGLLTRRITALAAQVHAATASMVSMAAELDRDGSWAEDGMRSCAHWLAINIGVDLWTGSEMIRAGHALEQLPRIAAAFAEGRLSFDKVRALTKVATPEDEVMWLELGLHASGSQLARLCRAVRRALEADDAALADDAQAKRSLRTWWRDDGMLELLAVLPREDGGVVMAAVEAMASQVYEERRRSAEGARVTVDVHGHPRQQLRADALVQLCEDWVASVSRDPTPAPTRQMVVHVDVGVLSNETPGGRCHIEDGPRLSAQTARWLGCDADIVTVVERDGLPIDVGHTRRLISPRQRLAMQARDRGCTFPGCGVPPQRTEGHHIRHWPAGPTTLANLAALCRFHHRRHHEGRFTMHREESGVLDFTAADGTPLHPVDPRCADGELPVLYGTGSSARALDGGAPLDFPYAVTILAEGSRFRRAAAANRGP